MKQDHITSDFVKFFIKSFFVFLFINISSGLLAQSITDFSGKWAFDISKSKASEGGSFGSSDIIHIIKQDQATITITEIFSKQDYSITNTFVLNGKETIETKGSRIIKRTAKWSQDKNILILTTITTIAGTDYRTDDSYKLENNGLTLIVTSVSDNSTKDMIIWVYNRVKD